jgi:hypothetical protein
VAALSHLLRGLFPKFLRQIILKATALTLNQETIHLYWSIGQDLSSRFAAEGWGTKVVDQLAKDLGSEFPVSVFLYL